MMMSPFWADWAPLEGSACPSGALVWITTAWPACAWGAQSALLLSVLDVVQAWLYLVQQMTMRLGLELVHGQVEDLTCSRQLRGARQAHTFMAAWNWSKMLCRGTAPGRLCCLCCCHMCGPTSRAKHLHTHTR